MPLPEYKVNLPQQIAECEANYWRLLKLLPEQGDTAIYEVLLPDQRSCRIELRLEQQCRYTSMISLIQHNSPFSGWQQQFDIRAYHDAMLAEVTAYQQHRRVQPRYRYPNDKMYQQDEKWQQNRFLSELLINCLKNGLAVSDNSLCES